MKTLKITKAEHDVLWYVLKTQIDWGTGGCFGDGEKITQKKELNTAKRLLEKLR